MLPYVNTGTYFTIKELSCCEQLLSLPWEEAPLRNSTFTPPSGLRPLVEGKAMMGKLGALRPAKGV